MNKLWTVPILSLAIASIEIIASSPTFASTLFRANLSGKNEIAGVAPGPFTPAPNNSTATGIGELELNDDETEVAYRFEIFGIDLSALQFGTQNPGEFPKTNTDLQTQFCSVIPLEDCNVASRLHIHLGSSSVNGPVAFTPADLTMGHFDDQDNVQFGIDPKTGAATVSGIWDTDDENPLTPDLVSALKSGNIYLNVHTIRFPGGEIRGQVHRAPEPGTLIGLAFAGTMGLLLRNRHKAR